uniref:Putative group i salivary lipocalin n=1 Tax=Rhipicephalus pulchellus TaxID=72859 RepID=L7LQ77_RHIPC
MAFITLAFVFSLAVGSFGTSEKPPTLDDLEEALSTDEEVWMKKRSYYKEGYTCVYSKKVFLEGNNYTFDQNYKLNEQQQKPNRLYATLSTEEPPVMKVSREPGSATGQDYTLQYWDSSEKCAILTLQVNGNQCELYAWDETVRNDLKSCEKKYKEICSHGDFPVYKHDC